MNQIADGLVLCFAFSLVIFKFPCLAATVQSSTSFCLIGSKEIMRHLNVHLSLLTFMEGEVAVTGFFCCFEKEGMIMLIIGVLCF